MENFCDASGSRAFVECHMLSEYFIPFDGLIRETTRIPRRTLMRMLPLGLGLSHLPMAVQAGAPSRRSGCQTNAWPFEAGIAGLVPVLRTIRSLGIQGYETSFRNVRDAFSSPKPARAQLEATGLRFIGMHIAAPDQYTAETSIPPLDFLREMADGASALGAEFLILSGRGVALNGSLDPAALNRKLAALIQVGHHCNSKGIRFAYHHHEDDFGPGGREIDEILSRTTPDVISLWLCVLSAQRSGVNPTEYFARHQQRIAGIHLKDLLGNRQVVLGKGSFDGPALARAIKSARWKGILLLEEERGNGRAEFPGTSAVRESRQYLKNTFGI